MFHFSTIKYSTCFITFFLSFNINYVFAEGIKENIIKIFPFHAKSDNLTACTGIALNEKYFITTQICAAQTIYGHTARIQHKKNDKLTGDITPNKRFTVGWTNNIVVGKFKKPLKSIRKLKVLKALTVTPGETYELIGFSNNKNMETFNFQVLIQSSNVCKNAKFEANKHFKFHEDTEICGEISTDNLSTVNYGSVLIDKSQNNVIGILSILTKLNNKKSGKSLIVLTRVSAFCDYISSDTNESFLCS